MTLNVGVIGVGMIGQEHIRRLTNVLAGARIVAVSDADAARAREVAARSPGAKTYATGEELIAAADVAAVVVTSWGPTHAAYVLAALEAGKPVFCEKPLATTRADGSAILDAEAALGRRLVQVGFMRRFDAQYRALAATIASGAIGAPLIFNSVHRNPSMPGHFVSEMALNDTAVHDIDISEISARGRAGRSHREIAAPQLARSLRGSPVHSDGNAPRRAGHHRNVGQHRLRLRYPRRGRRRDRRRDAGRAQPDRGQEPGRLFGAGSRRLARALR